MNEDEPIRAIEPPIYDDPVAARGDVLLRMCLNVSHITDDEAKAVLLRAAERMVASIPVAKSDQATISKLPGGKSL